MLFSLPDMNMRITQIFLCLIHHQMMKGTVKATSDATVVVGLCINQKQQETGTGEMLSSAANVKTRIIHCIIY